MSKDSPKIEEWQEFREHFDENHLSSNLFALNWEAKNKKQILSETGSKLVTSLAKSGFKAWKEKTSIMNSVYEVGKVVYQESESTFLEAKKTAKLSGKLLGCLLASDPYKNQTFSFVGFSLGCQVTKSCIKTLYQLGHYNRIHNVTFMGGAINFDGLEKEEKWNTIFRKAVGGQIRNVFSRQDYVL